MNKDEILQMHEGRKMRELIATLVMGWELYEPAPLDDRPRKYWRHPETKESRSVDAWHPDENMADAFLVALMFPEIHMEHSAKNDFAMIGDDFDTAVTCETMPLAICRSALLARGLTPLALDGAIATDNQQVLPADVLVGEGALPKPPRQ